MNRRRIIATGPGVINYFPPGPIGEQFILSDAFVVGIRGPIGSGKSVASVMKLIRNFQKQKPGPDGVTRCRIAVIRNTYPELKTTTIKTWHDWIPAATGRWVDQGPPTHRITTTDKTGKVTSDLEVLFVALDRPEDVRKLLSMELSFAWINEAREIPKAILDGLTGRVGRYPAIRDGGCLDPQIVMDTNSPDTDHWWAKLADYADPDLLAANADIERDLRDKGALRPDQDLYRFYHQPGGLAVGAENIKNLPVGYYEKAMAGKSAEWIKVYVESDYGFVMDGKPVYPEYHDNVHCKAFNLIEGLPIHVGIDFGLTPAATIAQRTITGQWRIYSELVTEDMGARRFGEILARKLRDEYHGFAIAGISGDPSGDNRSQSDESTPFQMLRASGLEARPAPTNDPTKRREAVAMYLSKMIDGAPGMIVHPNCPKLRKAMSGGYHYKRVQVAGGGENMYRDEPVKNMSSHVAESLQYLMMGAGEGREVVRRDTEQYRNRPKFARHDYDIYEGS